MKTQNDLFWTIEKRLAKSQGENYKRCENDLWRGTRNYRDINGLLHNNNGPAIVHPDGSCEYWIHGKRHNANDLAVKNVDGSGEYWSNGVLTGKKIKKYLNDDMVIDFDNAKFVWIIRHY